MASVSLTDAGAGLPRRRESPRFRSPWRSGREEGKGAGASSPLPLLQRGRGAGGEGSPLGSENLRRMAE